MNELTDLIVGELFDPKLDDSYSKKFKYLICKLEKAYSCNRISMLNREILEVSLFCDENDLARIKYLATLSLFKDLLSQGLVMEISEEKLYLKLPQETMSDKASIRIRLDAERRAQFNTKSIRQFVLYMERPRKFNDKHISVKNLIGDIDILIERIKQFKSGKCSQIIDPYIQLVDDTRDEYTGYKLFDIWKYFRYTWSIPYKTMPGRNIFYLVRDKSQPFHPVIGIFALGNTVLNLTVRDNYIGWTVESIKTNLERKCKVYRYQETLSNTNGRKVSVEKTVFTETENEYNERVMMYCQRLVEVLQQNLDLSINDIYKDDLVPEDLFDNDINDIKEVIQKLHKKADELREKQINTQKTINIIDWKREAKTVLFTKKRALELATLLEAKMHLVGLHEEDSVMMIRRLLTTEIGRKVINKALVSNRKNKIGSSMMEIIVCGSIPPYNELLGGKLVSILACSPKVISDYENKYRRQVSEIASRMKGEEVIRDARLAFLGTTSLYSVGSSQYNRIKVPIGDDFNLQYKELGVTEGYGTVYFSKDTTKYITSMLSLVDGGKKINHVFGEGTSPRFRLICRGLSVLGIKSEKFLKHYSPRIVYGIDLAKNTKEYLNNFTDELQYYFKNDSNDSINEVTQCLISKWHKRWLETRIYSIDIEMRLKEFNNSSIMLSNLF